MKKKKAVGRVVDLRKTAVYVASFILGVVLLSGMGFAISPEYNYYLAENLSDNGTAGLNLTAGASTTYASGKLNNAFAFGGNTAYSPNRTGTASDDFGTGEFSVSLWFYSPSASDKMIIQEYAPTHGWQLYIGSGHKLEFYSENVKKMTGSTSIDNSTWYLLIVQREADGKIYMYVNNQSDGTAVSVGDNYNTHPALEVGSGTSAYPTQALPSGALIDDIRIYTNLSLNATYRNLLYNNGSGYNYSLNFSGVPPPPVSIDIILPTNTTYAVDYHNASVNASVNVTGNSSSYTCNFTLDNITQSAPVVSNNTLANFTMNVTAGTHVFNAYCNSSAYNKSSNVSFTSKYDAELSLNSSSGWAIYEGSPTTISCSGIPSVLSITINGANVVNPYSWTASSGTYSIVCTASDTTNFTSTNASRTLYVNKYISCFNSTTFGYELNYTPATASTTFNFTSLVNTYVVKSDLSDVWVLGMNSSNVSRNATNGYYLVVNSSIPFTMRFTNYFANNNYSLGNISATMVNVTNHTQVYPVVVMSLLDENNETSLFPPNTTASVILECSRGENFVNLPNTTTHYAFSGLDYFSRALVSIKYSSTVYYSRQLYIDENAFQYLNFYVADAYIQALDRVDFVMLDSNKYDSMLQIYKTTNNGTKVIDEGYFDASHYHSAYLIEDMTYYLKTYNDDGTETEFGIMVITAPGEKELSRTTIDLNPDALLIADYITMNTYTYNSSGTTYLRIIYTDAMNETEHLNITAYLQNGSQLANYSYNATNNVDISINVSAYANQSFRVFWKFEHETFGNSPVEYQMPVISPFLIDLGLSSLWMNLISMFFILTAGGIATATTIIPGTVITMIMILFFYGIGWLDISLVAIAFILLLMFLAIIYYIKKHE